MTNPNPPLTEIEAAERIAQQEATKGAARRMAAIITEGMQGETGTETEESPVVVEEATPAGEVAPPEAKEMTEGVVEEVVPPPDISEIDKMLQDAGIDLGMGAGEVPAELLPVYEKLVQSAVDIAQSAVQERIEAAGVIKQVEEFRTRLKEKPEHLLLSMAVNNPEAFTKAMEVFNEMQQDARVKELVVKELESEARLREAERKEALFTEYDQRMKAQRVITATKIATRKYGIPYGLAEKVVASIVVGNGGNLDPREVDGIVSELASDLKGKIPAKKPLRVATPQKQEQVSQANTSETAGSQPAATQASKGLTETTPHDRLRKLIQSAAAKFRPSNQ